MDRPTFWYTATAKDARNSSQCIIRILCKDRSQVWYRSGRHFQRRRQPYAGTHLQCRRNGGGLHSRRSALEWLRAESRNCARIIIMMMTLNVGACRDSSWIAGIHAARHSIREYSQFEKQCPEEAEESRGARRNGTDLLEKKAQGVMRKMHTFQDDVVHTVRVLMQEKIKTNHDYEVACD